MIELQDLYLPPQPDAPIASLTVALFVTALSLYGIQKHRREDR